MDFQNAFDAQIAVQTEEEFKRLAGYASVAVLDQSEAKLKLGRPFPYLVIDSEHSGVFCQRITQETHYDFLYEEKQLNILVEEAEPQFSVSIQLEGFEQFQKQFEQALKAEYQKFLSSEDASFVLARQQKPRQTLYTEEADVEDGFAFRRKPNRCQIIEKAAISSVDELVYYFAGQQQNEIILKDVMQSGKIKLGAGENLIVQSTEAQLYQYDIQSKKPSQNFLHFVKDSNVQTNIVDFATAQECQNILNSSLTSQNGLVGISANSLFVLDKRVEPKQATVDESQKKEANYQVLCVSKQGHAAVANAQGDISLFAKIGNRALNILPGTGQPVVSLSIDDAEQYIIATTKYMVVLYFVYGADGTFGFKNVVKAANRQAPIFAKVAPDMIVKLGVQAGLAPAFIQGGKLITGSSKYLLVWKVQELIEGKAQVQKIALQGNVIGGGAQNGRITVGLDKGWGFFK